MNVHEAGRLMPRGQKFGGEREVRLRPAFAHLYPKVLAGVWMPAWAVAEQLLERMGTAGLESPSGARVCDPRHFDFRGGGGRPPEPRAQRTRAGDGRAGDRGGEGRPAPPQEPRTDTPGA